MGQLMHYVVLWVSLFFLSPLYGQYLSVDHHSTRDGLPQRTVRSIAKDKYGFMWFGTWNGLCRYDGYRFKVYQPIPGDSTSIGNSRIHYMYKAKDGTLWVATFNSFICRYNYETDDFTRFKAHEVPQAIRDSTNRLNSIQQIETYRSELTRYIGPFHFSENREHIVFQTSAEEKNGLSDNHVNSIYFDDHDLLWLGTTRGGLNKINLQSDRFIRHNIPHSSAIGQENAIRAIWSDKSGTWVGTQDDGLFFVDPVTQSRKKIKKPFVSANIRTILKDRQGNVWVGSRGGLDKYIPETGQLINYFGSSTSAKVDRFYAAAEDPLDESIWFGSYKGIMRYVPEKNLFENVDLGKLFSRSGAGCIYFDSHGRVWLGTEYTGLICLERTKDGKVKQTFHYAGDGADAVLPDERVYSVAEDNKGMIWIGTANGLCQLNPENKAIRWFGKAEGLPDQFIAKVLFDGNDAVWLGHKRGISKLSTTDFEIQNYTIRESKQNYESLEGAGWADYKSNQLLFGGMDGFISFDPKEVKNNTFNPPIVFTNLLVQNADVKIGEQRNGDVILPRALNLTEQITLSHRNNSFSIEFAALDYSIPRDILYAYKLDGLDEDWIYTDATSRTAMYRDLDPGRYVFEVKASNSNAVWSGQTRSIAIEVLPPWWQTWWSYMLYAALFVTAICGIIRYLRIRQMYSRSILAERIKAEKAKELEVLKTNFFTQVSHELRTPLSLLVDPLDALLTDAVPESRKHSYYLIMKRNAERLLKLVNQILDFRKIESSPTVFRPTRQDIAAYITQIVASVELQTQQKDIELIWRPPIDHVDFTFDPDAVEKILYNLIGNALKFTPQQGRIELLLGLEDRSVTISVANSGSYINERHLKQVFEPFYQIDAGSRGHIGTGIGLSIVYELVLQHGGQVTVTSEVDGMTTFTVRLAELPAEDNLFSEDTFSRITTALEEQGTTEKGDMTVLVIEDDDDVRNYLCTVFMDKGYRVEEAAAGDAGWQQAIELLPDIIVSDVMMPGYNGFELARRLKSDQRTSHIPVVLLTAKQEEPDQIAGYETGADAFVSKPFSSSVLLSQIDSLVANRQKLRAMFNNAPGYDVKKIATNEVDAQFLEKARSLIQQNMANNNFDVDWLAAELLLSRTQLYRKLKALTDQSVYEFITTIRLSRAAELLLQGDLSVNEIAFELGYADSTSFGRAFQKQYGTSPKKYGKASSVN